MLPRERGIRDFAMGRCGWVMKIGCGLGCLVSDGGICGVIRCFGGFSIVRDSQVLLSGSTIIFTRIGEMLNA